MGSTSIERKNQTRKLLPEALAASPTKSDPKNQKIKRIGMERMGMNGQSKKQSGPLGRTS
jgi:hypothetical protein